MEKIYREVAEKSEHYQTDSPCVQVRVFIPTIDDDYDLPALILLNEGTVNSCGETCFNYNLTDCITELEHNHNKPYLIRQAIKVFDQLKEKIWNK